MVYNITMRKSGYLLQVYFVLSFEFVSGFWSSAVQRPDLLLNRCLSKANYLWKLKIVVLKL